ncbi:formate/nitrite transporter family protein [Roseovarius sp. D22-M7]|uniref:formate/nitrite transporter family protein n=1 Tax=Roseovarius sp. D22-M7 TaxID=3127116 RepID=UPI00300F9347
MAENTAGDQTDEHREGVHAKPSTSVIFDVIRREGEKELARPSSANWWSGIAAGLAISTSVLCTGFLVSILPEARWTDGISNLGYTVGFLMVILGRMQLFTEKTITPILPLFLAPGFRQLWRIIRLWGIVFAANLVGCAAAAWVLAHGHIVPADRFAGILAVSRDFAAATPVEHFARGIPAGFIVAGLVWLLPRMKSAGEVMIIVILTYMIGLGDMSHVVAGATELFILTALEELELVTAFVDGILPALAGNILGGTGIFAALAYAQVREEI